MLNLWKESKSTAADNTFPAVDAGTKFLAIGITANAHHGMNMWFPSVLVMAAIRVIS